MNAKDVSNIDCNEILNYGFYGTKGSSPSSVGWKNYPINSTGMMLVTGYGVIVVQIYFSYQGGVYIRNKMSYEEYEWSPWTALVP